MTITQADIQKIIDGSRIEIDIPYPWDEQKKWYMKQPDDWLYDYATAIREAAEAELLADPAMQKLKTLPPSDTWIAQQELAISTTRAEIEALEKKGKARKPEEDIELQKQKDWLARLLKPSDYNRAEEMALKRGKRAFESWLIHRLIVDESGSLLFDVDTEAGKALYDALGMQIKAQLRTPFYYATNLVMIAKNLQRGQSTDSSSS